MATSEESQSIATPHHDLADHRNLCLIERQRAHRRSHELCEGAVLNDFVALALFAFKITVCHRIVDKLLCFGIPFQRTTESDGDVS